MLVLVLVIVLVIDSTIFKKVDSVLKFWHILLPNRLPCQRVCPRHGGLLRFSDLVDYENDYEREQEHEVSPIRGGS